MRFHRRVLGMGLVLAACTGCSSLKPNDVQDAKDATKATLTGLQQACVIANAIFPATKIAEVCGIVGPAVDLIMPLASSTRAAGAAQPRSTPVKCEETDAGIACETKR